MDDRIASIEKELAVLAATQSEMKTALQDINTTLNKMLKLQTDTEVLRQRLDGMDRELVESFKRVHIRVDKLDETVKWVSRTIIGTLITGFIGLVFYALKHVI